MISYRDMTFCPFYETCKDADDCPRPLTEEVKQKAREFGLGVSVFGSIPKCYNEKEKT